MYWTSPPREILLNLCEYPGSIHSPAGMLWDVLVNSHTDKEPVKEESCRFAGAGFLLCPSRW